MAKTNKQAKHTSGPANPEKFLDSYLPYLLGHASSAINKDFNKYVQDSGITPLEWRILATLCDNDGLTIGELAYKVVALQPTLTKAVKKMEEAALVHRISDELDRRKTLVIVSEQGRALCNGLIQRALQHEQLWLRDFTPAEVETVRHLLQSVIDRSRSALPFLDPL